MTRNGKRNKALICKRQCCGLRRQALPVVSSSASMLTEEFPFNGAKEKRNKKAIKDGDKGWGHEELPSSNPKSSSPAQEAPRPHAQSRSSTFFTSRSFPSSPRKVSWHDPVPAGSGGAPRGWRPQGGTRGVAPRSRPRQAPRREKPGQGVSGRRGL